MRLSTNLHTPLWSLDILAKRASVNCPMTDGLTGWTWGGPGLSFSLYIFHPTEQDTVYSRKVGLTKDSHKSASRPQIDPPSHFSAHHNLFICSFSCTHRHNITQ